MKILVPIVLATAGIGAGVGAGLFLRPDAAGAGVTDAHGAAAATDSDGHGGGDGHAEILGAPKPEEDAHGGGGGHGGGDEHGGGDGGDEYVSLANQFIVPILNDARVQSLVVLSIDLEVGPGGSGAVYRVEPKIRDAFLTVLFDHANAGGFNGTFTSSGAMEILRTSLREAAFKAVGDKVVTDVLITGIVRQDV